MGSAFEKNCSVAGSALSVVAGAIFFVVACISGAVGRRQEWIRETQAAFDEGGDRWETVRLGRAQFHLDQSVTFRSKRIAYLFSSARNFWLRN